MSLDDSGSYVSNIIIQGGKTMETTVIKFKVESFRKIPNPYANKDEDSAGAKMFIAICDVKELPDNIPMETNPREQKLTTAVPKKIAKTLLDEENKSFYLLNRGLLLSCDDVSYNNYSNELTLAFTDYAFHGNIDGGHTYKIISENKDKLNLDNQFVKLEILTGVEDIFQNLAAARNTSTQVQDKSIAELENRFEIIKQGISSTAYGSSVYFKENDEGEIDVADIVAILNLFNLDKYPDIETFPIVSYNGKKRCIDMYIDYHKKYADGIENPFVKMQPIMKDIFKLYNTIEVNMGEYYRQKNTSGKYGAVKGVTNTKGEPYKSKFEKTDMQYTTPTGFLYPILGSFRALLEEKNGYYSWIKNPFVILDKVGKDIVETTVERSRTLGNNPNAVGKDSGNWKTLYMTVKFELMS